MYITDIEQQHLYTMAGIMGNSFHCNTAKIQNRWSILKEEKKTHTSILLTFSEIWCWSLPFLVLAYRIPVFKTAQLESRSQICIWNCSKKKWKCIIISGFCLHYNCSILKCAKNSLRFGVVCFVLFSFTFELVYWLVTILSFRELGWKQQKTPVDSQFNLLIHLLQGWRQARAWLTD